MDDANHILCGLCGGACHVSVIGKATAHHCPPLRDFVLRSLADGATRVTVDLANCCYGDSTFLGTLLEFRHACQPPGPRSLVLQCPTPEFLATLRTMGLLRLFVVSDAPEPVQVAWVRLPAEQAGRCSPEF